MNTSPSTPASPDASTYAPAPFSRRTLSLKTVQACIPSRNPGPMADWWARHANGGGDQSGNAPTLRTDENVVGDTVAAFRVALRRAEGVESAADLQQDDTPPGSNDEASSDSLDYFAPAFHRALGRTASNPDVGGPEKGGDATDESTRGDRDDASSAESLDYFAPAFHRALGRDTAANAKIRYDASTEAGEGVGEDAVDAEESTESLDYFAPAFRRALGRGGNAGSQRFGRDADNDASRDRSAKKRIGETMQGLSGKGFKRLSGLKISDASRSDLDLDRLAEPFFTSQSRELVGVNGC